MHTEVVTEFAKYKKLGEQTLAQVTADALNYLPGTNSIALIVCHLHGNLLSCFTDFLTTDGEKPWRNRAAEFAEIRYTRPAVETLRAAGWAQLEATLAELADNDLQKLVAIKGKPMTVACHVGQMCCWGGRPAPGNGNI